MLTLGFPPPPYSPGAVHPLWGPPRRTPVTRGRSGSGAGTRCDSTAGHGAWQVPQERGGGGGAVSPHPIPRGGTVCATPPQGGCEASHIPPPFTPHCLPPQSSTPASAGGVWGGGGVGGNLLNCDSCSRAKPQQKPFSAKAFPVPSHHCHSPCPLLSPSAQPDTPPPPPLPPLSVGSIPIPLCRRCELDVRAGEKA